MLIQAPKPLRAYLKHLFKITTHKIELASVRARALKKALERGSKRLGKSHC